MKQINLIMLFIVILVGLTYGNSFTIVGHGRAFYEVDMADIRFGITVEDPSVQESKKKHDTIVDSLKKYLREHKYTEGILKFEETSLARTRRNVQREREDFYTAKSVYFLRTDRLSDLSQLLADLVSLGIDEIYGVQLFSSKEREYEDEARKLAIKDAFKQAELTSEELGWKLGGPVSINWGAEQNSRFRVRESFGTRASPAGSSRQNGGSANFIDIEVTINFSYEYSSKDEVPGELGK